MQLTGGSSGQKNVRLNSCESNSDDEIVERDNHVSDDTPVDTDDVGGFGLYKTGTDYLSTESVNSVNPYVVNVQLDKAKVNCKIEVDTGASRSSVSKPVYA